MAEHLNVLEATSITVSWITCTLGALLAGNQQMLGDVSSVFYYHTRASINKFDCWHAYNYTSSCQCRFAFLNWFFLCCIYAKFGIGHENRSVGRDRDCFSDLVWLQCSSTCARIWQTRSISCCTYDLRVNTPREHQSRARHLHACCSIQWKEF